MRVPGFVLDFSRRFAARRTATNHILHISDWLPTFLAWAGRSDLLQGGGFLIHFPCFHTLDMFAIL